MTFVELRTESMAVGGDAVGRDDTGRVVFVEGALPGERVRVEVHDERARFAKGRVVEVLEAAASRREPPCPHVAAGCGGCGWQHVAPDAQVAAKLGLVRDTLTRLGGVADPVVEASGVLPDEGFRTTVRLAVRDGRAAYRMAHSHDTVAVDSCLVAHPLLQELIATGDFGAAREVTLRVGAATGERMALVSPNRRGVRLPDDVVVVGTDEVAAGRHAWIHEEVAGRRWRVSAASFFQTRADGAGALVAAVAEALSGGRTSGDALGVDARGVELGDATSGRPTLVDVCCGVGLLAGGVAADLPGWRIVGVERSRSAVADARHNLADLADVKVVRASLESWRPSPATVAIADPARSGLGKVGVARVAATGAGTVVLVSCDPAALGRDAGLFTRAGYELGSAHLVDLFPQTPHVEVVSTFHRG